MSKKIIISIIVTIIIITVLLILFIVLNDKKETSEVNVNMDKNIVAVNNIDNQSSGNSVEDKNNINNTDITNKINNEISNIIANLPKNYENNSSIPDDTFLTVGGVHKTYNQDIMSEANIAFLLEKDMSNYIGKTSVDDLNKEFSSYINNHMPKNGILISNINAYKKISQYDVVTEPADGMKNYLNSINMTYQIDKNNYLIESNNSKNDLSKDINKAINGNKKIIIGFVPYFYSYINDTEQGLRTCEMSEPYISLKPYNNIYTFICNPNEMTSEDFMLMLKEIAKLQ